MTEAERLEVELRVLVELHEFASAPYHDQNDVRGHLTARKRAVRRKLKAARRA